MSRRLLSLAAFTILTCTYGVDAAAQSLRAQADALVAEAVRQDREGGGSDGTASQSRAGDRPRASAVMMALYGSAIVVHGLDAHSTLEALDAGAIEANPMLRPITHSRQGFIVFKSGVAAATIYAAHHLSRRHKVAAILALAAVNSVYGAIAARNYRLASDLRAREGR